MDLRWLVLFFTRTLRDCFTKLQTFYRRKHSFYFQDGTEQTPATSLPFIWTSVVLKGNDIVNLFLLFKKDSTHYCTFQVNKYYSLNGEANLWLFNPSVSVSMCSSSLCLFLPLIKMYVCQWQINVTQPLFRNCHQSLVLPDRWSAKDENIHLLLLLSCSLCIEKFSVKSKVCDRAFSSFDLRCFLHKLLKCYDWWENWKPVVTQVCRQCCCSVLYFYIQTPSLHSILYL